MACTTRWSRPTSVFAIAVFLSQPCPGKPGLKLCLVPLHPRGVTVEGDDLNPVHCEHVGNRGEGVSDQPDISSPLAWRSPSSGGAKKGLPPYPASAGHRHPWPIDFHGAVKHRRYRMFITRRDALQLRDIDKRPQLGEIHGFSCWKHLPGDVRRQK